MVNLDEDYKKYMARLGKEQGLAEGRAEGIKEERNKTVGILAINVGNIMKQESVSFDEAFKRTGFPEEYREDVRVKVESS
jgi:predicted transposase YdaD